MTITIHQPVFLPYLGTLAKTNVADVHVFLDDVQLNTRNFTRRCFIRSHLGGVEKQLITVPLNHSRSKLIKDTTLDLTDSNNDWLERTLKTFDMVYSKAPHYKELRDGILTNYFDSGFVSCLENNFSRWTISCYIATCHLLNIHAEYLLSSQIANVHGITSIGNQRLIDICKVLKADTYISGEGGLQYMNFKDWHDENINVLVGEYIHEAYKFPDDGVYSFIDPYSIIGKQETMKRLTTRYRLWKQ